MSNKYYDTKKIDAVNADYNLIVGERSNGKSYALKKKALELYAKNKKRTVWIRRWPEDMQKFKIASMFSSLKQNGEFEKIFDYYNNVNYQYREFYLSKYDAENRKWDDDETSFMKVVNLADWEHDKDTVYTDIGMIVFDEFITRDSYIVNEFIIFLNVISTLVRDSGNVKIYMLGNTLTKNCPYFAEMGLKHIYEQKAGTIDIYTFNNLKIAVERVENKASKKSDKFFAFDNPKLKMITKGTWELDTYQHLPFKIDDRNILSTFVIKIQNQVLQCDCYSDENGKYIYIHKKTSEIKENTLTYDANCTETIYTHKSIMKPRTNFEKAIYKCIVYDRLYFQDNEIGELFNDYIKESESL